VQHVRRVHPEVADGTTETEDEDPDHSYFNSKLDYPPQSSAPPPLPSRRPPAMMPMSLYSHRNLMSSRRGRRKTVTAAPAVNYYSRADRYVTIVDRRERRNQQRMEKQLEDQVRQLRRLTCARSRSIDEHRTMGRGGILTSGQDYQSDDTTEVSGVPDVMTTSSPTRDPYPYHDHSYYSLEPPPDRFQALWKAGIGRAGPPGSTVVSEVSAFQECETMLLGLPASGRGGSARGRGRPRGRGRGGWSMARRLSGGAEDLDPIDPAIRDLDLLAESELLLRPVGDYSILQDILGPHCMSASQPMSVGATPGRVTSPMKSPAGGLSAARMSREPTRSSIASDGTGTGLNDSLSLDEASAAGPSDLDDIELCEDDYRLFDPRGAAGGDSGPPAYNTAPVAAAAAPTSWKNGIESPDNAGVSKTESREEREDDDDDLCAEPRQNSVVMRTSVSVDDFDDETRSATSEPEEPAGCTSFETETDQEQNASIPAGDDDDDNDDVNVDISSDVTGGLDNKK